MTLEFMVFYLTAFLSFYVYFHRFSFQLSLVFTDHRPSFRSLNRDQKKASFSFPRKKRWWNVLLFREELHCKMYHRQIDSEILTISFCKIQISFWICCLHNHVSSAKYAKSTNMLLSKIMIDNWSLSLFRTYCEHLYYTIPPGCCYGFISCTHKILFIQNANNFN